MYTLKAGGYVWADRKKVHKQGKVLSDFSFVPIDTKYAPMVQVAPMAASLIDRPLNLGTYPEFWIDLSECLESSTPVPHSYPVTDAQALAALRTLHQWLKQS